MSTTGCTLEELRRKLQEFERMFPALSPDAKRKFDSMMRTVKMQIAQKGKAQAAD